MCFELDNVACSFVITRSWLSVLYSCHFHTGINCITYSNKVIQLFYCRPIASDLLEYNKFEFIDIFYFPLFNKKNRFPSNFTFFFFLLFKFTYTEYSNLVCHEKKKKKKKLLPVFEKIDFIFRHLYFSDKLI